MAKRPSKPTNMFSNLTEDELRVAFIKASKGPQENGNAFFNKFIYVRDLFNGNPATALNQGLDLLNRCRAIDETAYIHIHKGSAYYWIGIAAFLMHEHELATFFFDAAVAEDLRGGYDPVNKPTPSFRFIQVEGEPLDQAARQLVQITQARIEELIENYNARPGRSPNINALSIDGLRKQFLRPAISTGGEDLRSSATTLISYSLEWDFRNMLIDIRPLQGTSEPFLLHLFKGCVLFESILKRNPIDPPPQNSTLGYTLNYLHSRLGIPAKINIGNVTFPKVIADLSNADESIQTAIKYTGRIRNTLGHDLGWVVNLNKVQYHRLFRMISSSCFHAIACLYR